MGASDQSLRVLIIEDNRDFVYLLRCAISQLGHIVESAYNGADGIHKAKAMKPDVIFCDIGLPGIDGFEVARTLRCCTSLNEAYMVALTGYGGRWGNSRAMESGFNLHIAKPVGFAELKGILNEVKKRPAIIV